jgi:hypothetical protein
MDKRSLTERDICTKFVLPAPSYRAASGDLPPFGYGLGQCSAKPARAFMVHAANAAAEEATHEADAADAAANAAFMRPPRRYQVLRLHPSASHGRCAGRRGMIPCAGIKIHPCLIAMPSSICNGGIG